MIARQNTNFVSILVGGDTPYWQIIIIAIVSLAIIFIGISIIESSKAKREFKEDQEYKFYGDEYMAHLKEE